MAVMAPKFETYIYTSEETFQVFPLLLLWYIDYSNRYMLIIKQRLKIEASSSQVKTGYRKTLY